MRKLLFIKRIPTSEDNVKENITDSDVNVVNNMELINTGYVESPFKTILNLRVGRRKVSVLLIRLFLSCSHLPVSCRSLVHWCYSLGSCRPQIYFLINLTIGS